MKGLKNKVPISYTKLDRVEYIYAWLAPYGITREKIKMVLEKDEEFAKEVLRNGDIFKFGGLCKIKLRYVPKRQNVGKYDLVNGGVCTVDNEEHNRVSCIPFVAFNKEIKELTWGDAYYYDDEEEDCQEN